MGLDACAQVRAAGDWLCGFHQLEEDLAHVRQALCLEQPACDQI